LKSLQEAVGDEYVKDPVQARAKVKARISKLQKALEEQAEKSYALETTISKQAGEIEADSATAAAEDSPLLRLG
jgi:phage protein D